MKNSANTQVTNTETQEKNKLIAEFMGYEIQKDPTERFFGRYKTPITKVWVKENELSFDTDWNWLMPVIAKCRVESNEEDSHWEAIYYSLADLDIDNVYTAVVNFIKWYNANK